ncbi:hypothetical protein ABPG72_001680 [Tetrahymena utriculariae]
MKQQNKKNCEIANQHTYTIFVRYNQIFKIITRKFIIKKRSKQSDCYYFRLEKKLLFQKYLKPSYFNHSSRKKLQNKHLCYNKAIQQEIIDIDISICINQSRSETNHSF